MRTVAVVLLPTLFWAGTFLRIPAARRSVPQRTLCLCLAAFAAALTLNVPSVYLAFDRLLGVPNLADLAEHVLGVWGVAGILRLVRHVTGTARTGRISYELALACLATVALTVLFAVAPIPTEAPSFTAAYGQLPEIVGYWMVTILYFGVTLAELARLSLRYAGRARRLSLRIGLHVLGAGVALGVAYSLAKVAELAAAQLHADAAQGLATTGHVLLWAGGLTMGAGLLIPASGPRLLAVERAARWYVALYQLRGLWDTLWRADPYILLEPPPTRWQDVRSFQQLQRRLSRRIIEIRDGLLALRPFVTDEVAEDAVAVATAAGLTGAKRDATVDACRLAVAVASKRSHRVPAAPASSHTGRSGRVPAAAAPSRTSGTGDLADEVEVLCRLARVHRHSPVVRSFVATHVPGLTATDPDR